VRATFLEQQPSASYYVDFNDFAFYRLEPSALRYVGGFGRMSWVTADDYRVAHADPLASASAGIIKHMNETASASRRRDRGRGCDRHRSVDRYGFELAITRPGAARLPGLRRAGHDRDEVRKAMIALVACPPAASVRRRGPRGVRHRGLARTPAASTGPSPVDHGARSARRHVEPVRALR
jgi:hypothetical protein